MAIENMMFRYGDVEGTAPSDVTNTRQYVFDYMYRYGQPVIVKRIYNTDDVALERAEWDETFDDVYEQSSTIGSNLGFSAGWGKAYFTYMALGDGNQMVDDETPNRTGVFKLFQTTGVAPWNPLVQDGDMIITVRVQVEPSTGVLSILGEGDRFRAQAVYPVPLRAELNRPYMNDGTTQTRSWIENLDILVCQNFEAVRIPHADPLYKVEIGDDKTIDPMWQGPEW
jgi:hypothetical protein